MVNKKIITLFPILGFSLSCFCGCTVYRYNPLPSEYEAELIIGHTAEEIMERYGTPYFIRYFDEGEGNVEYISAIAYQTGDISEFLDGYVEFLYIQFDEETGLANSMIHPWTDANGFRY